MSQRSSIIIVGPEDKLISTPPPAAAEQARIATTRLDDAAGGEVTVCIDGHVRKLPAYEAISVPSEVVSLLEDCGFELEYEEEEPQA